MKKYLVFDSKDDDNGLSAIRAEKLNEILHLEYLHKLYYRTWRSLIRVSSFRRRRAHRRFIDKKWAEYSDIENI